MLAAISADLGLTSTQAGSLVTWTLMGAVAGGLVSGTMSDHFGRIRVVTWTILVFAGFTALCALAQGYWDLVAYRVMAGLGLRGEFGIGMALAAEAWPASKRARVSSNVALGWQAGVLLAALVTPVLLPVIGWRGMVPGRPAARACGVHRPPHSRRAGDLRQKACCQERKLVSFAGQGSSDIYVLNIISTVFLISEPKGKELD